MEWVTLTNEEIDSFSDLGYRLVEVHSGTYTFEFKNNQFLEIILSTYCSDPNFYKHELFLSMQGSSDEKVDFTKEELKAIYEIYKRIFLLTLTENNIVNKAFNANTHKHLHYVFTAELLYLENYYNSNNRILGNDIKIDNDKRVYLYCEDKDYTSNLNKLFRNKWIEVELNTIKIEEIAC